MQLIKNKMFGLQISAIQIFENNWGSHNQKKTDN